MRTEYMDTGDYRRGQNRQKLGLSIIALSLAAMLAVQSISYLELEKKLDKTEQSLNSETTLHDETLATLESQAVLLNQYKPLINLASEIITGCKDAIAETSYCMVWNVEGRGLVAEGNL
jgi:hypothetical protein